MSGSPEEREELAPVYQVLRRLGLSANYLGFYQMAWAVRQVREEPEGLLLVTKAVYPAVGRRFHSSWEAVERNLRTAVRIIWEAKTPLLKELMGPGSRERPCTARFLALLAAYLEEKGL